VKRHGMATDQARHGRACPGHLRNDGAATDGRIKSGHDVEAAGHDVEAAGRDVDAAGHDVEGPAMMWRALAMTMGVSGGRHDCP
jgi:hypothetical protein